MSICSFASTMVFFIPRHKISLISPTFIQSCSLYLLCTEFSDSWIQWPQPRWFTAMVIDVVLLFSLYLISGFRDLDSLCLTCGFGDLDLIVKIWSSLHVLVLDFDFKCIWFLWIGNLNGYDGFDLRFPWICCLCCYEISNVILFSQYLRIFLFS